MQHLQRPQKPLNGVGQSNGRGGIGQKRRPCDQAEHPDCHGDGGVNALLGKVEDAPVENGVLTGNKQQIQRPGKDQDGHDGLQAPEDQLHRDLRHSVADP